MASKETSKRPAATDKIEWIIAVIGMAMLSVAFGFILYRAVTFESKPADLSVLIESVVRGEQGYRVDFLVKNSGTKTAAAVVIEGELSRGGQSVEKSNATLAYAPANSIRRGGIYFTHDPDQHELKIRAAGFEKP
jgi:uncharacterized protein (TIGR02588 family)